MKLARRVGCRTLDFSDLSGGINVSELPENIKDNEMQSCKNFIYDIDSSILVKRGGLGVPFATYSLLIIGTYYNFNTNQYFVFLENKDIYINSGGSSNLRIGRLNGDLKPICCTFGNKVFIASGDTLQVYDGVGEVRTITNAPKASKCFVKDNRVCVFSGSSTDSILYESGVGDGEFWDDNENDDSGSTWVQIGNGGCGIIDCSYLANDIIFFMSNGEVYDMAGKYPDWDVNQIVDSSGFDTRNCSCSVGNDVVFVGRNGLQNISTVQKYSNVEVRGIGDKFDLLITSNYSSPRFWKIEKLRSVIISPNQFNLLIVYNFALKAATTIEFPFKIVDIFEDKLGVVVVSENSMFRMSRNNINDNGVLVDCSLVTKRTVTIYDAILVTMVDFSSSASTSGVVSFNLKDFNIGFSNLERNNIKLNYTVPYIEVRISSTDDVVFNRIVLEITDV